MSGKLLLRADSLSVVTLYECSDLIFIGTLGIILALQPSLTARETERHGRESDLPKVARVMGWGRGQDWHLAHGLF